MSKEVKRRCTMCKRWKPKSQYYKTGKNPHSLVAWCKTCSGAYTKNQRARRRVTGGIDYVIQSRVVGLRYRSKKKGILCSVSKEYLKALWETQKGLCYYTGIPMEYSGWELNSHGKEVPTYLSVDRRDNSQGYVEGNVVWCCWAINQMKNDMVLEDFVRFCTLVAERNR